MKKLKHFLTLIITLITCFNFIFLACGCGGNYYIENFICFSSPVRIETDVNLKKEELKEITAYMAYLENDLSVDIINSSTYKFNSSKGNQSLTYSDDFKTVLTLASDLYNLTKKNFNVAVYPLALLWKFTSKTYNKAEFSLPSEEDIQSILPLTDFSQIDTINFTKTKDDIKVDLGGIAKGYALDKVSTMLKSFGVKSGYINVGSSSLYLVSTNGLGIVHPRNTGTQIITINKNLKDTFVSTSGDYQRYYLENNVRYSHILDTKTGYPTNTGIVSATIIGNGGAKTDAISTALCLMTKEEIIEQFNKLYGEYQFFATYINPENDKDKCIITNANKKDFTLHDKTFNVIFI